MRRGLFKDVGENKRARRFHDPWPEFGLRIPDGIVEAEQEDDSTCIDRLEI